MLTSTVTSTEILIPANVIALLAKHVMTSSDDRSSINNVRVSLSENGSSITLTQTDGYRSQELTIANPGHSQTFPRIDSIRPKETETIGHVRAMSKDWASVATMLKLDKASRDNRSPDTILTFDPDHDKITFTASNGLTVSLTPDAASFGRLAQAKIGFSSQFLREVIESAIVTAGKLGDVTFTFYGDDHKTAALRPVNVTSSAGYTGIQNNMLLCPVRLAR